MVIDFDARNRGDREWYAAEAVLETPYFVKADLPDDPRWTQFLMVQSLATTAMTAAKILIPVAARACSLADPLLA